MIQKYSNEILDLLNTNPFILSGILIFLTVGLLEATKVTIKRYIKDKTMWFLKDRIYPIMPYLFGIVYSILIQVTEVYIFNLFYYIAMMMFVYKIGYRWLLEIILDLMKIIPKLIRSKLGIKDE
jgi:hypothetical protein